MRTLILVSAMLIGCRGTTEHKVSGQAEVRHVITIQFGTCDELPRADKIECVKALLSILEKVAEQEGKE